MLLILDNFEHLLEGAGLLAEILGNAPAIKLLVTSRERLGLQWEWPLEIGGLEVPQGDGNGALEACAAVQVLLHSAKRVHPQFAFEIERPHVAHICRYLEGIPLAIELAAAWVEAFPCREIAREIEHNLSLLASPSRDIPERHRSLRAAFDHSWNLLAAEERNLFAKLSVFRGGFSKEAAEAVAGASLHHLSALAHKSLLQREALGRYRMLQILRQYAEEKLRDTPEWTETHDQHCEYYTGFLQLRKQVLREKRQETLKEVTQEIEDIRAGWQWAVTHHKGNMIARTMEGLFWYYETQSWFEEGNRTFGKAADELRKAIDEGKENDSYKAPTGCSDSRIILGGLLVWQGWFQHRLSCYEESIKTLQESLSCLHPLGNHGDVAFALSSLGANAIHLGDSVTGRRLFQESLSMYEMIGDRHGVAKCLVNIGINILAEGDSAGAKELFQKALVICTDLNDQYRKAFILNKLGSIARQSKEYAKAEQLQQQALSIFQGLDSRLGMTICYESLGLLAQSQEKHSKAKQFFQQALTLSQEIGNQYTEVCILDCLGFTLCATKEYAAANECFYAALKIAADINIPPHVLDTLVGIGIVAAQTKERRKDAVEIAALVLNHPLAYPETKKEAERLLSELEPQVPAPVFAAAQERGRQGGLEHYVQRIIDSDASVRNGGG
jgi:predicted ATPase/Tfp pilus assembly protein PilF